MTETKIFPLATAALKDTLAPSACLVCSGGNPRRHLEASDYITGEKFAVYLCEQCGVGFTWPQPEGLNRYYPPEYRAYVAPAKWFLRLFYRLRAKRWVRELGASGYALEIGCGDGWMLQALRDMGWEVVGLERTDEQARVASSLAGVPVRSGRLQEMSVDRQYDLILMHYVLEHLPDPVGTLHQCASLLRGGGFLIASTQNLDSWQAKWAGSHWFHLDIPRHLFHFSPDSMKRVLIRQGFRVARVTYVSWVHDPYGWVESCLNWLGFKQNLLTRSLSGHDFRGLLKGSRLLMSAITVALIIPSLFVSVISWVFRSGALMEFHARRSAAAELADH